MRHSCSGRMESPVDKSVGEVTVPCVFTFVPVVRKLPIKSCLETTSAASEGKQHENTAEETTREAMSGERALRAGYIPRSEEREGRSSTESKGNTHTSTPPCGLVSGSAPTVSDLSENTPHWGQATMEAAAHKHADVSQQRYQSVPGRAPEVRYFKSQQDRASPTCSADLFPTPASSRESILSADLDKDASPISGSRTISPCSSVYSGIFTPSIVPVKKHFLAPGSSLISLPQSCRSSYESLSYPMSPTPTRHRPPLTRLSLLTAILRKGRLPILSSAVQRPYTPCWPVNRITLSHCSACSAASSVASIPLELSSEFSSSTSIDSQSDAHRDPSRCATAPPLLNNSACPQSQTRTGKSNAAPRWRQIISPPPRSALKSHKKNNPFQQVPQPVCSSIVKSVSPVNLHRSYVSVSKAKSPTLKPSFCLNVDNKSNKLSCLSPEPELDTGVPQKWTRLPSSSFSKLQSLSQQLKTPSPLPYSSENVTPAFSPSPPPPARLAAGKPLAAGRSEPKSSTHMPHCLSPSRYTPMAFTGWPSPRATPSPTSTSTLTPSPAPPVSELAPSPSLSLRSTPSPRPGSGRLDGTDREGKKRKPHKIKSSYKSLAAIPTNTLLLDQQVIDEQVERGEDTPRDRGVPSDATEIDTHNEMCSPAWLRKESEELYAVIDEILANSISSTSKSPAVKEAQKNSSTFPRNYGRETKYASVCSLNSNGTNERKADPHKTKPGVIRSVTRGPTLTTSDHDKKSERSPLKQFTVSQRLSDSTKGQNTCGSKAQREEECSSGTPACDLHISEPEEHIRHPTKHGPPLGTTTSFCPAERKLEAFETQI